MKTGIERILIIKPSSLGDIIHGLMVAEAIQAQLPDVRIDWVVRSEFAPLVEAAACVQSVHLFERKGGVGGFLKLIRSIRSQHYDVVLDMQGLARSGLMTMAARAGEKIGRADAREGAGLFYSKRIQAPGAEAVHAVEILSQFLPAIGLDATAVGGQLRFDFPAGALSPASEHAKGAVLVFPESRREEKEWPQFPGFLKMVAAKHHDRQFIWCGSDRSADACPAGPNVRNVAGRTSLLDIVALIQDAAGVVANDSGPVHIAAAVGTPVLGLFGPTPPELYGPYPLDKPGHRTLRSEDHTMASIELEAVVRAFEALIEKSGGRALPLT